MSPIETGRTFEDKPKTPFGFSRGMQSPFGSSYNPMTSTSDTSTFPFTHASTARSPTRTTIFPRSSSSKLAAELDLGIEMSLYDRAFVEDD